MDERTKEIRKILTGFISYETYEYAGTVIVAAKNLLRYRGEGGFVGADSARFFGVRSEMKQYVIPRKKVEEVHAACFELMLNLGRRVYLYSAPDALTVLCRPAFRAPLIVTMEAKGVQLLVCVYTARTLLSRLNMRRMLEKLAQVLPSEMSEAAVTMAPASAAKTRAEKKAEKEKKKAEKAEKKAKSAQQAAAKPDRKAQKEQKAREKAARAAEKAAAKAAALAAKAAELAGEAGMPEPASDEGASPSEAVREAEELLEQEELLAEEQNEEEQFEEEQPEEEQSEEDGADDGE